ncbi:winged helix DNA-binding protein [Marinilongibacter aquaticus]|uniref:MarR family winged helix-turn-helix transcriptional regulator n=1 Tax=Marinilongibacter aquaticus TaxID=2975157 RepID=UPI0021BD61AF|nr:MarR family transcriptional regulator [Marinilongibacter aquaticus]UBM59394.1 winged helix DNA-binding protein [Marinilongibacter aquaticus]
MKIDMLTESLRSVISGLHKSLRRHVADDTALSLTEMEAIGLIFKKGAIAPSELAAKTKVAGPSMSQILKKLENLDLILRKNTREDRRKVLVSLTEKGEMLIQRFREDKDTTLKNLIETRLNQHEIDLLEKALPALEKLNAI